MRAAWPQQCRAGYKIHARRGALPCPSTAPHEWHFIRHDCHKQNVGIERQACHIDHRVTDMVGLHARLHLLAAVRLKYTFASRHAFCKWSDRIANVDLPAADLVCRLLLEKKKKKTSHTHTSPHYPY